MTQAQPRLIQVVREPIRAGNEAAYQLIEDQTARACVDLNCPHPHLALEPLRGPAEVWWLNFFESEEERQEVTRDYEANVALMEVLLRSSERKSKLTGDVSDVILTYRPDLSQRAPWGLVGQRFIVVSIVTEPRDRAGAVYEAPDGSYFVLRTTATQADAERLAAEYSPAATVLAVRPSWGLPAKDWIEGDPTFWRSNPAVSR